MIVDHCSSTVLDETIARSIEDRRSCDFHDTVRGEKILLAPRPVQLGGRILPQSSYPPDLTRSGFVGCIKNFVHNGEVCFDLFCFYRAMHFSAKRGIAIACRPSVRLSVCPSVCL